MVELKCLNQTFKLVYSLFNKMITGIDTDIWNIIFVVAAAAAAQNSFEYINI